MRRNTCTVPNAPPAATRPVTSSSATAFTRVSANAVSSRSAPVAASKTRRGSPLPAAKASQRSESASASFDVSREGTRSDGTRPAPAERTDDDLVRGAKSEEAAAGRHEQAALAGRGNGIGQPPERASLLREDVARENVAAGDDHELRSDEPVRDDLAGGERQARRGLRSVEGEEVRGRRRAEHCRDVDRAEESGRVGRSRNLAHQREKSRAGTRGFAPGALARPAHREDGGREEEKGERPAPDTARRAVSLRVRLEGGRSDRGDDGRRRSGPWDRARVLRKPVPDARHRREEAGSVLPFPERAPHDEDGLRQAPVAHRRRRAKPPRGAPPARRPGPRAGRDRRARRSTSGPGEAARIPGRGGAPSDPAGTAELVQIVAFERVDRHLRPF